MIGHRCLRPVSYPQCGGRSGRGRIANRQEIDRVIPGPAVRLGLSARTVGAKGGAGSSRRASSTSRIPDSGAGPAPGDGGGPDWLQSKVGGFGRPGMRATARVLAALMIKVSGPLGVCHDSKGPQALMIRKPVATLRRGAAAGSGRTDGSRGGGEHRTQAVGWPSRGVDQARRPTQGRPLHLPRGAQRLNTTSGPLRLWRNTKGPQPLIIRTDAGLAAGSLVSGRFHPGLRRLVAVARAPAATRA